MNAPTPPTTDSTAAAEPRWVDVCALSDIPPGTGVAALVEGHQIALVRWHDGAAVYALSNFDPFSDAFVLARGIVGDRGGVRKIASPIYKQNFDLATGRCLDDDGVQVRTFRVRIAAGRVAVEAPNSAPGG